MTHLTSDYLNPKIEISWRTYEIWPQGACQISQILDSRKIIWKQDYSLDCETKTSGGASLRPRARRINAFPLQFLAHFAISVATNSLKPSRLIFMPLVTKELNSARYNAFWFRSFS